MELLFLSIIALCVTLILFFPPRKRMSAIESEKWEVVLDIEDDDGRSITLKSKVPYEKRFDHSPLWATINEEKDEEGKRVVTIKRC